MIALDVIREIEALGGSLHVDDGQLRVRCSSPVPEELLAALTENKPAIMIALGAPLDSTIAGILADARPYLPPALKKLPDDRLLALVNWSIIAAWGASLRRAGQGTATRGRR